MALKGFNYEQIYTNPLVKAESSKIKVMYSLVFSRLVEDVKEKDRSSRVFTNFLDRLGERYMNSHNPSEMVRDFIAGLTDSGFLRLFTEMFVPRVL